MTRAERIANLIGVVVPFLGLIAAVVLLWQPGSTGSTSGSSPASTSSSAPASPSAITGC